MEIRFTYSSFFPGFESDIYIDVADGKAISKDGLQEITSYISQFREILLAENIYYLDELLSYRAVGNKICIDIDTETGFKNKFSGNFYIGNLDITKLKDIKEMEDFFYFYQLDFLANH